MIVQAIAENLLQRCRTLYPITRSITGDGVRETLALLQNEIPLSQHEVPSGTQVFDWEVPLEWNLTSASLSDSKGNKIIDACDNNLHVVSYSVPTNRKVTLTELEKNLHSLPSQPDLIPYRTSYYDQTWGFCLSHEERLRLTEQTYHVVIDSRLEPGSLSYGELFLPGSEDQEILISTHICHPSLANDNLSGITVATELARHFIRTGNLRYGLRFIFIPGTIGAITWLAQNQPLVPNISSALVLSGVGDAGNFTYKFSRRGDGIVDRLFATHLAGREDASTRPFLPYGYDERQFCSPGINIAAGCLMRTPYGEYPEYHTSGDNLDLLSGNALLETYELCRDVLQDVQRVAHYRNLQPYCEPQLGKRGLYEQVGGQNQSKDEQLALLWMLNYSDTYHSTLDIHELSGIELSVLDRAASRLVSAGLLEPCFGSSNVSSGA